MKYLTMIVFMMVAIIGCTSKREVAPVPKPVSAENTAVSEEAYRQIEQRILSRIRELKAIYASLRDMTSPSGHKHNVKWVLDDPEKPHSKLNARRAVFGDDGYWFSLQFYRGEWKGAAFFRPIEFGDLKLWFRYGHGGNSSVIAAVASILRDENEAFCKEHSWQLLNQELKATGEPAPWLSR